MMCHKKRIVVIADDITGAAEIAGIAFRQGRQVSLVCASSALASAALASYAASTGSADNGDACLVIATDTRSMTAAEAASETCRIASFLSPFSSHLIYKKTDSALRGNVVAELSALMQALGHRRAVYLPANPSKGRVIRGGIYYVGDKPIHTTDFSFDPEYPARTSKLKERFPDAAGYGIVMPDAESLDDIRSIIARYDDGHTLFAGAADLFSLLSLHTTPLSASVDLNKRRLSPHPSHDRTGRESSFEISGKSMIFVCGSTQSHVPDLGIAVAPMPLELYEGSSDAARWPTASYAVEHSVVLTIPHRHLTGKDVAMHLRRVTALKVRQLVAVHRPCNLVIEGGATAWAVLQSLGWTQLDVVGQIAPGVVTLRAACGTRVTLKPGSYRWTGDA